MGKPTDFQREVLFWQGVLQEVDEDTKTLALSPEMDEIVEIICQMLSNVEPCGERDENMVAFKVWKDGSCLDVARNLNLLGKSTELSAMLYGSAETVRALQYRGTLEGFKILRHASARGASCTNLRSYVIQFVPPDE